MIDDKIADAVTKLHDGRIMKFSQNPQQNNSEIIKNVNDKEIPKERYIYITQKESGKFIDNLRLI